MYEQNLTVQTPQQRLIQLETAVLDRIPWDNLPLIYIGKVKKEWQNLHLRCNPQSNIFIRHFGNVNPHGRPINSNSNTYNNRNITPNRNVHTFNNTSIGANRRANPFNVPEVPSLGPMSSYTAATNYHDQHGTFVPPLPTSFNNRPNTGGLSQTNEALVSTNFNTNSPPGLRQAAPNSTSNPNVYNFSNLDVHGYQTSLMTSSAETSPVRAPSHNVNRSNSIVSRRNEDELPNEHDLISLHTKRSRSGNGYQTQVIYDGEQYETRQNLISDVCAKISIVYR